MPRTSRREDEGLRGAYERFIAGDPSAMMDLLADDVVWRMRAARCVELWAHFADQAACDRFWHGFS